jgi:C_GCAxxG_C_C family probable redox protein
MLLKLLKRQPEPIPGETCGELAGRLFASGMNCAEAVALATTGSDDPALLALAKPFGGGIGGSKCLCGAVSGGVLALGYRGRGERAGELVQQFKTTHRVTCCSALSKPYRWKSPEHLANCRRLTETSAELVAKLLEP